MQALPTELPNTGLVVYPLTEEHEDEDTIEITGSCEDFCDQPGPTRAAPVEIHGPLCRSRPCGREIAARGPNGSLVSITLELVRPYLHGRYLLGDCLLGDQRLIKLSAAFHSPTYDQEPMDDLFIEPGAALRLAAALTTAAHQADQLARDLSASALSRERGRFDAV